MKSRLRRAIEILVSAIVILAAGSVAAANDQTPTTQPASTTQPVSPEIADLIRQLGDNDFHVRQSASAKLEALGKAAIPALQEARNSPDPEVHTRAEALLANIDHPVVGPLPLPSGYGKYSVSTSVINGNRKLDMEEPGRTTHIEETPAGQIKMKVSGQIDGKPVTREYDAKNAEQLKKDAPDAFALYQRFNAGDQIIIQGQGGQFIIRGNARMQMGRLLIQPPIVAPVPPTNPQGDNLGQLAEHIRRQMDDAKTPNPQRDEVDSLLKKLQEAPTAVDPANPDAGMLEYNRRCDALREKLTELKLPDPGDALPPPASGRLGISAAEEAVGGLGLIVTHVLPDSRGAKLGLKDLDVIQKVNHDVVRSTRELRKLVTDHPKGLVIEGLRDGKEFKLEEKP